ncbi:hypothetical protein MOB40_07545 [Bacillus inaquosorum]|uniref:Uncharacterized protein n=2 Tax=Bacillus inaquosorum TaxID=483913 RepID=A0A9W5LIM6_9BACI|nr:hypothetical protein [Bacillus inaquosorum]RKQ20570.1 hypothetical protein D3797_011980 [Bacillus subtilis]AWM17026.1 hypothetical protein DKG76_09570 [Bacillus inaquosorum]ELS61483.1 hypothetical protein BSI_18540 [Bacillus inaquosorum KCTC 13429]MCY7904759.1 hypothetical protein [Bacillus inaquosorum]MCY7930206.1 hypothetical protein [Bacillus inaquosorum]
MAYTNTQLSQWLESKVGQTLDIRKGELNHDEEVSDLDQIVLHLQKVGIRSTNHPDDYVAKEELVLEGEGTTYTEDGDVPLPQNAYEIPLLGDIHIHQENEGLKVVTDRAVYTIDVQHS